jgi:hypothetical protein
MHPQEREAKCQKILILKGFLSISFGLNVMTWGIGPVWRDMSGNRGWRYLPFTNFTNPSRRQAHGLLEWAE